MRLLIFLAIPSLLFSQASSDSPAANLTTKSPIAGVKPRTQQDKNYDVMSVKDFGAKGDVVMGGDGAITSGAFAFCSAAAHFSAAPNVSIKGGGNDVGKAIGIDYSLVGGTSAYAQTTITAVTSSTCVTVMVAAGVTVTAATYWYSRYDDTVPINAALTWACSTGFESKNLFFPQGIYRHTDVLMCDVGNGQTLPVHGVALHGEGAGAMLVNTSANKGGLLLTTNGNSGDVGTAPVSGSDFFETHVTAEGFHLYSANTGTAPFALRVYNQNGLKVDKIIVEGMDHLAIGIDVVGSEDGSIRDFFVRGAAIGMYLREAPGIAGIAAGNSSLAIDGGFLRQATGSLIAGGGWSGTYTSVGTGACLKVSSAEAVTIKNIHFFACAVGVDMSESDEINTALQGVGLASIEFGMNHFEAIHDATFLYGPRPYQGWIWQHDNNYGLGPLPAITPTTIATSFAAGVQTVTPAAIPTGFVVGKTYVVASYDGTNSELIIPTAVTGSTFTANFTMPKVGPGITVTAPISGVAIKTLPKAVLGAYAYNVFTANSIKIEREALFGQVIIHADTERVDLVDNAVFGSSQIVNGSANQFHSRGSCDISGLASCPPSLHETPTIWPNQAEWHSPSLFPGVLGAFVSNPNIAGSHVVAVVGAGGSPSATVSTLGSPALNADGTHQVKTVLDGITSVDCTVGGGAVPVLCSGTGSVWEYSDSPGSVAGVRLGANKNDSPGVYGDTGNSTLFMCAHDDPQCIHAWSKMKASQYEVNVPLQLKTGTYLASGSPTISGNRRANGEIVDSTKHVWDIDFNAGGNNLTIGHADGSGSFLGTPFVIDSSGYTILQHPLAVAYGGTGTATPGLVAGTNITVTGAWPNQTIAASTGTGGLLAANNLSDVASATTARANLLAVTRQSIAAISGTIGAAPSTYTQSYETSMAVAVNALIAKLNAALTALNQ